MIETTAIGCGGIEAWLGRNAPRPKIEVDATHARTKLRGIEQSTEHPKSNLRPREAVSAISKNLTVDRSLGLWPCYGVVRNVTVRYKNRQETVVSKSAIEGKVRGGSYLFSLVVTAGIDVDDVGVAHHDDIAFAELSIEQSGSDILFREVVCGYSSEETDSAMGESRMNRMS